MNYNPAAWYWTVGGDATQAYSSAAAAYVPAANAGFVAWLAAGNVPTRIDTAANLNDVLLAAYPPGAMHGPSVIPSLAFLSRFTTAEINAIQTAALAIPTTAGSLALHSYLMQLGAATVVDLTSPLTTGGLAALVAAGLLTATRQAVILTP